MKTLKLMLAGIAILFTGLAANATVKPHHPQLSQDDVINLYVTAITNGSTNNFDKILDDNIQFNSMRGDKVNTLNKDQFVTYVKNTAVTGVQVNTVKTVLASDDNDAKIKIEFQYDGYTRTDILTLGRSNSWKIITVDSSTK